MLSTLLMAGATTLAGIIVRIMWDRKMGRHLRAKWHRRWLWKRKVVLGTTVIRRPGPSQFERFRIVDVDGSDVLLEGVSVSNKGISVWLPIAVLRNEGLYIATGVKDGGQG